ncbi:MAG TPA: neutral/alkaline non-lysosomal ceramidase N-terminal domain-containing protein [Bryobacteraceae bacterium]|nr:neutral/alkaline non-lysosomal ceramidase N-terminal domain-containing protein [Bryobacteraceae bacterium]
MKKALITSVLALGCLSLSLPLHAADLQLQAGVAKTDITPSTFGPMYGYANRKCGPANGTHDPLYAKALVLAAGDSRLAIVTLDLGSIVSENLKRDVAAKLGIPVLLLAASHTHSGPIYLPSDAGVRGITPPSFEPSTYQFELEQKIFGAIRRAASSMFPARLGIGQGSLQLGYNRLLLRDDGRARALFDNLERVPYGPVDPEFTLLRVEDMNGAPRALLVHYACHAVVLGPTSCLYSADYPGAMQAKVEGAIPGVQCMFVQGGAGDINPLFEGRTGKEDEDLATMQKMGELLADQVLRSAKDIKATAPVRYPIQSESETLKFADRWEKDKSFEIGITTVLINREIAIAAVPGEPMHRFQTYWKHHADVPYSLFYGYTYSAGGVWPSYIPDIRSAAYGGYGADFSTRVEVGAGETIMQHHLINLYKLLGMWRDKQGQP